MSSNNSSFSLCIIPWRFVLLVSLPNARLCHRWVPRPPHLPKDSSSHPSQPEHRRNNAVRDFAPPGVICELQAEATVYDAESDEDTPDPDVRVGPDLSALVLFEVTMVDDAQDRLEEEKSEDNGAENGVVVIELRRVM